MRSSLPSPIRFFRRSFSTWLQKAGFRLHKRNLARLLAYHGINSVIDVGSNCGQFALDLRQQGFRGTISSFEPLADVRQSLSKKADRDPFWSVHPYALGDKNCDMIIHRAGNTESSSLLEMLPAHQAAAPYSKNVGSESVMVRRLDSLFDEITTPTDTVFLKIDAQGYEMAVLLGADTCLDRITGVQIEASLIPLYDGEACIETLFTHLRAMNFIPVEIEPTFRDQKSLHLLQCDAIFMR